MNRWGRMWLFWGKCCLCLKLLLIRSRTSLFGLLNSLWSKREVARVPWSLKFNTARFSFKIVELTCNMWGIDYSSLNHPRTSHYFPSRISRWVLRSSINYFPQKKNTNRQKHSTANNERLFQSTLDTRVDNHSQLSKHIPESSGIMSPNPT